MTKEKIRLGVVGYGSRGRYLFRLAAESFKNVTAAAVCDKNPAFADTAKADHPDVQFFTDFDEMLGSASIDALFVETPATRHAGLCVKALERNIHVMSDVPCADNAGEAKRLWEAHQKSRALYMLGANTNMWGFVEAAVDLKRKGLLGDVYYADAEYIHDCRHIFAETPWRATYEAIKYCTHSLGPLLRLIDEDLEWVSGFDTGSHVNREAGQHDAMTALFRTPSNVVVRLLTSFINNCPVEEHHYRVYGTKGYFERTGSYDGPGSARTLFYSTELYGPRRFVELPVQEARPECAEGGAAAGHGGADFELLDRFFTAIRENQPSPIDLREALRMSLPGIYAAESARRGGEIVRIEYPWSPE